MESEKIAFKTYPITLEGDKLNISLDKLNEELSEYKIRVDSLSDIYIDKEASALNNGDVLKIHAVYINPDEEFDEKIFFHGYLDLEDKFEENSDLVSSAEFDVADLVTTIVLNKHGIKLHTTLEEGGQVGADETTAQMVDQQLAANAKEVFDLVGIELPDSDEDYATKLSVVKSKAIEHYNRLKPKPQWVFYGGAKMDIAQGAGHNVLKLQKELAQRLYEIMGKKMHSPNHEMQNIYANNKAVLAIDMLRGMAQQSTQPVFHISDTMLDEVVDRVQEAK